jgi:hypothetical protein
MVLEEMAVAGATFEEIIRIGQVCGAWRAAREKTFLHWTSADSAGSVASSFAGFPGQLDFVRDHVQGR